MEVFSMINHYLYRGRLGILCLSFLLGISWQTPVFGQASLLLQKDGAVAGDKLGWCVAGAGDVNGDGKPDYIVGMPYYDPSGLSSAGAAIVYSGATGAALFQKNGTATAEGLGYWVAGAGDVNGDGRADFIVASQTRAFVYSGANGALLYQTVGGGPVAGAGDINGDGRGDFMVSDLNQSSVYSGANGAILYQKIGGSAVAGVGDVNGDGRPDFLVGDQYADPGITNAGSAYVYSGANGSLLYQKNGAVASDLLGCSAAGVGDVNGDGRPDFIVGARLADVSGQINTGAAYVYSGATGALLYQKSGPAGQQWGQAVGGAGDVNGDGRSDFLVGSIWTNPGGLTSAGSVFVYSGANGALLQQVDGKVEYENFGYTVSAIGDINGNGRSEFIVGGPNASPGARLYAGTAYIFGSGGSSNPCDLDATPPVLACPADKSIGCGQTVTFDQPTASDNCDPAPVVSVVSTTQSAGPGPDQITYTRTWVARDARGNTSSPCDQSIVYTCVQASANRSQVTVSGATCASFVGNTATDLTELCYAVKRGKISSCTPNTFRYYVAVTAPSTNFTVDIVQTRYDASLPYIGVAASGVSVYDNCTVIGSGTSSSLGQAQVTLSGAVAGRQYVIAVLYSTSSLTGTYVGTSGLILLQHYNFSARINGQEITRDADGLSPVACVRTKGGQGPNGAPTELAIESYPNPFNASAQIQYSLPAAGKVRVVIYNVLGREVRTLIDEYRTAGEYSLIWNGTDEAGRVVPSGVYFLQVSTTDDTVIKKLNLLK